MRIVKRIAGAVASVVGSLSRFATTAAAASKGTENLREALDDAELAGDELEEVGDHLDRRWRNQEATTQIAEVSVGMASPNDFPAFEPGSRYLYLDPKTGEIFDLSVGEED